jgi:site-specific recombinase XerD
MAQRRLAKAIPSDPRGTAAELRREAPEDLSWEAAIGMFVEGWAADHPGIRPGTLEHYREQLANRIAAFAKKRGITSVQDFGRHDLRAFVVWLDSFVTANDRPLTPRGKDMALATAKRFLGWLYQERLLPEDIAAQVGTYRLDTDPEPKATPSADLEKVLSSLDVRRPTGIRNMAMIHLMAFCGLRQ